MRFDSETGMRAHQRAQGLGRARYWRELGFPNMALARVALREWQARVRELKAAGVPWRQARILAKRN